MTRSYFLLVRARKCEARNTVWYLSKERIQYSYPESPIHLLKRRHDELYLGTSLSKGILILNGFARRQFHSTPVGVSTSRLATDSLSTMAQYLESIVRLLLGLTILTFPIILPVLFSFLLPGKEGEGISNENMWIQERQASRARDRSAFCNLFVHCTFLHILASNHGFTDTLSPRFVTSFCYLQVIDRPPDASDGVQHYTYGITQSVSYVSDAP